MTTIPYNDLSLLNGGKFVDVACDVVTAGTAIYNIGGAINFWNPIAWVCGIGDALSAACFVYWADKKLSNYE